MIRQFAFAVLATATIGVTAVPAQTVEFGPGGPSVDLRSRGQRERDLDREEYRREQRRRDRAEERFGDRGGCRTVTVREQDDYGRTVTRTRRDC